MTDNSTKFKEAYAAFAFSSDEYDAIEKATNGTKEYVLALFKGGKYLIGYKGYNSRKEKDCLILPIPPLTPDDYYEGTRGRYYTGRATEIRESFAIACKEYDNRPE